VNKLEHSFGLSGKTFDHYGNERSGDTITFSTTSSLVQVTPSGNVVTKGNGKARITLTSGTDTSSVLVHIAQKATSVTILGKSTQGTDTITALQFGKRMTHRQADGNGQAINDSSYLSSTGWVSRNPAILTVTQTADSVYVTSVSNGTAVVVDSLLDNPTVKDSVIIIVQQHVATSNAITITETASGGPMYTSIIAGSSYHVRANGIDAKGNRVTAFTWTSSDTTVLKVTPFANSDSANIQTVGTHTGTATITVKDRGNKSASVTITVTSSNTGSVQQTSGQSRVAAAGTNPPWIERSALTSRRESGLAVT
jgi:hypothetical protein